MTLEELKAGDTIVANYGSEYREMEVLSNDADRKNLTVNVLLKIGLLDTVKRLEVLEYDSYNLKKWGYLEKESITNTNQ